MTVDPTDKFLVNRSGSSYHVDQQDLMAQLEDDDLLLVNRNSKSYKITGAEFKDSLSSPPIIQSVTLTEDDPAGARFTSQDFTTTAVMLDNGTPASTKSIRGWVEGSLTEKIETDTITAVDIPATPTSYSVRPHNVQSALLSGPTVPFNSADAFLETGIPLGTPPSVAISTHWLLFDLGVAATVTIGRESAGASASTAVLWGTNDPNASWTYVATGEYTDMREVSGSGYRFYAYGRIDADNIDGTTQTQTSASAVYFVTAASGGFPTLTFASDKDLAKLQPGDYVEQENARASITPDYVINEYRSTTNGIQKTFNESGVDNDYSRFLGIDQIYWADLGASKSIESIRFKVEGILDTATEAQLKNFILYYSNSPTSIGESICGVGCNIINQLNYEREANGDVEVDFDAISNFSARYIGLSNGSSGATAFNRMVYKDVRLNLTPDPTPKPSGIVGSVNVAGNSLTLSSSDGTWGPANANPGHYAIGPSTIVDNSKKYLNLDASLNVIGLTDDDTYTRSPANTTTPKISFPATLDNGEVPDAALPPGTSIQTEFKAENTALPAGTSMVSNVVTPSPSCVSGPIETDVIIDVNLNATGPVYSTNNDGAAMDSPWSNAFDGDTSTFAETSAAIQSTLTFSPAVDFSKLEIYAAKTSGHVGLTINENVVPDLTGTNPSAAVWQNITSQVTSPLRSLELSRGQGPGGVNKGGILMAVRVNDKILIDGESQTALTFASDKNLAKLQPGNTIYQEDATLQPALFFNTGFVNNRWDNPPAYTALDPALVIEDVPVGDYFTFPGGSEYSMWQCWSDLPGGTFRITFKLDSSSDSRNLKVWFSDNGIEWTQQANVPFKDLTSGSGGVEFNTQYLCLSWDDGSSRFGSDLYTVTGGSALQPYGKVGSIDVAGNSLTMSDSHGTWGPANQNHYAIGPNYICPPITLDADDPDDVETFYAIKAALVQYESERIEFRELLITALTDAGFTAQQIASVMRE